jgi:hypothetical protein
MLTEPVAVPPWPSLTDTSTRITVADATDGGVNVTVAPEPVTVPPVADHV